MQLLNTECDRQNSLITGLLELVQLDRVAGAEVPAASMPQRHCAWVTAPPATQEKGVTLAYTVSNELPTVSCLDSWLNCD